MKKDTPFRAAIFIMIVFLSVWSWSHAWAQGYQVGISVCDTIGITRISHAELGGCEPYDFLSFRLGHQLDPYVTGLSFQLVITKTNGRLWSSLADTLKAGDILPIPAPTDSGVRVYLTPASSFEFLARIIGTPTKAYESYYCGKIGYGVTTQVCRNIMWFSIIDTDEAICQVQPASSVGEKNDNFLRVQFQLRQNHPNPFNASTNIEFALPRDAEVSLKVYTLHGEEVAALLNQSKFAAGSHSINWNARTLPSGVYVYRLQTNNGFVAVRKLVLLK